MNNIVIDCYNHINNTEHITILVNEDIDINQLEFILKKKLKIKLEKNMKIYMHTELDNKDKKINELHKLRKMKLYYLIMESPKPIRSCHNFLSCASKRN